MERIGFRPCRRNPHHRAEVFLIQNEDDLGHEDHYSVECPVCGFESSLSLKYIPYFDEEFQ